MDKIGEIENKLLELLNHPDEEQINEWRKDLYIKEGDEPLPLLVILIVKARNTSVDVEEEIEDTLRSYYSILSLIKFTNSTDDNDIFRDILMEKTFNSQLPLHPSVFNGPYAVYNILNYYNELSDRYINRNDRESLDLLKLYLDVKPKPHTVQIDEWWIREVIWREVYFSEEGEADYIPLPKKKHLDVEKIIRVCEYAIEEGVSVEAVLANLINKYGYNDVLKYILDKYIGKYNVRDVNVFLSVKGRGRWNEIILNQI